MKMKHYKGKNMVKLFNAYTLTRIYKFAILRMKKGGTCMYIANRLGTRIVKIESVEQHNQDIYVNGKLFEKFLSIESALFAIGYF